MDAFRFSRTCTLAALLGLVCVTSTGCLGSIIATGFYVWQGGKVVPAECDALE